MQVESCHTLSTPVPVELPHPCRWRAATPSQPRSLLSSHIHAGGELPHPLNPGPCYAPTSMQVESCHPLSTPVPVELCHPCRWRAATPSQPRSLLSSHIHAGGELPHPLNPGPC